VSVRIRVLFFGVLRDLLGNGSDDVSLPEGATLRDLLARYETQAPRLRQFAPTLAFAINQEYAAPAATLRDGDEVAFLPPVSGGATVTTDTTFSTHCALTRQPLCSQALVNALQHPEDGAVVVFEGVVRNHTRNRRTLFLDYEAYEDMALAQIQALIAEARRKFAIRHAAIHHRLGRLEIGEISVVIVVASAHRAPAFDASRWLIDTLKRTVPIWKKEHFEDGAVWADGEPFPVDILAAGQPASERQP
jgi:molybdopterin converting factor subunit 1